MRALKFRAWDSVSKKMWTPDFISCAGLAGMSIGTKEHPTKLVYDSVRFPIMQFTGLLDKNGKEIYEGDIVKDSNRTKYEVIWVGNGLGHWWIKRLKDDFCPNKNPINLNLIEVIGNIYESKEAHNG